MTFVGHSLVGTTIAIWSIPESYRFWQRFFLINLFILLAYLPDLPFPFWGHSQYHISHSIFINLSIMIPLALVFVYIRHTQMAGTYAMIIGGLVAWLSHFVLDSFYNHGLGIAIFWPVSDDVLNLPIPWFSTLNPSISLLSRYNLGVFGVELLFYFPVFLVAIVLRKRFLGSKKACPKS